MESYFVDSDRDNHGESTDDRDDRGRFAKGNKLGQEPGQPSRGASGRPKGFSTRLREALHEAEENGDKTRLDKVVDALLTQAEGGNVSAIKEVADRDEGRTTQKVELTGAEGGPLKIEIPPELHVDRGKNT